MFQRGEAEVVGARRFPKTILASEGPFVLQVQDVLLASAASPRCSQSAGRMADERPAQFELLLVVDEEDEEDDDDDDDEEDDEDDEEVEDEESKSALARDCELDLSKAAI